MGTVWLSRLVGKHGFERLVALKTILPSYTNDRVFCDMFLDEARIAAQIDHENVARILEIGEDKGMLFYAMELIDGQSLRKLYRDVRGAGHSFPMGVALRVVADACAGLHATHELRGPDGRLLEVVHRDVSPQNLLLSVRGTVKLIDFGVAKARARRSEETAAGTLKGKIEYMAPEQARGESIDRRADVYSLGAVLFELIAGRPVRDTDDGKQLAALHELMTGAPYMPLPPTVPNEVRALVDRALARDPAERFATADELRHAIENAMVTTASGATPDDVAAVLASFSRERTARRKDAIDQAIRAAEEGRVNAATLVAPVSMNLPAAPSSYRTPIQPGLTVPLAQVPTPPPPSGPVTASDGPGTGPSMRTMAGAELAASRPSQSSSAAKVFLVICMLMIVGLLGGVAGVVITKRGAVTNAAALPQPVPMPVPVPADPPPPAPPTVAVEPPPPPATGTASASGRDGGTKRIGGPGQHRPPGRPGAKPADGDEYGF
jgi:serine/threonine-protein kinase